MGDRLTTTGMDRKLGGCAPLGKGELGAHVTMWPGLRRTNMPNFVLSHVPD